MDYNISLNSSSVSSLLRQTTLVGNYPGMPLVYQCDKSWRECLKNGEHSGRVLDLRPKGRGFKLHRLHCFVVLEQDTFILA